MIKLPTLAFVSDTRPPLARSTRLFTTRLATLLVLSSVVISLSFSGTLLADQSTSTGELPDHVIETFGNPPTIPTGKLDEDLQRAVNMVFVESMNNGGWTRDQTLALGEIAESEDPRLAWPITDLMRFVTQAELSLVLAEAAASVLDITLDNQNNWGNITDHLMAWDIPAPPDYLRLKRSVFTSIIPGWDRIFVDGSIDWRHVSWGGVLIDDRAYDTTDETCNCIPAADNPATTSAADAAWLDDDDVVFGVVINGEARAYPRRIMEVREMVNDTLGGRHIGMPYCTLCASAQAYFTDELPDGVERPVLRTSGLLIRSNKVMYDITSYSVFDTFLGHAVTGPLAEKNIQLDQASVVTTQWGAWKKAYPDTTVLAEELALGRDFDFRNNRDADGPIFPVGDVDPRLPVHEDVVGVLKEDGSVVAFQLREAQLQLVAGKPVEFQDIKLVLDGGGIKAESSNGQALVSHQAFWFAWSQFYPDTDLWPNSL